MKKILDHEHIYEEQWYPLDKKTLRRVCVLPGCCAIETKEV